jgi:hypothetical protein
MLIHRDPRILDAGKCAARQIVCGLSERQEAGAFQPVEVRSE